MRKVYLLIIVVFVLTFALGQDTILATNKTQNSIQQQSDPNETILKYEDFLRKETEAHRQYTQDYYSLILKTLSALSVIVIGVFAWLNWKSKSDIKKQVNEYFKDTIQGLLDEKLSQIDGIIKDNKEKSLKQFEEINKLLLELSAKSEKSSSLQPDDQIETEKQFDVNLLACKRILWVDDNPRNNEYPKTILEQAGVKFELAFDTKPAVELLKRKKFDLIISDMGRGKNRSAGLDLLKELKSINIQTPVIIYASSRAIQEYGKEALSLGAIAVTTGVTRVLNIVQKVFLV